MKKALLGLLIIMLLIYRSFWGLIIIANLFATGGTLTVFWLVFIGVTAILTTGIWTVYSLCYDLIAKSLEEW